MYSEDTLGSQVTQVGMEFNAGPEANAELCRLLGKAAGIYGGRPLVEFGQEWIETPNLCDDAAFCIELLEQHGIVPFILPTTDHKRGRAKTPFIQEYVAVFEMKSTLFVTTPQLTEDAAAACVLWYALSRVSHE